MTLPKPYYEDEAVTIYHGDCREILQNLPAVDAIVTDPPFDQRTHEKADYGFRSYKDRIGFAPLDVPASVPLMLGASEGWVVAFCAMEMLGDYAKSANGNWVRSGFWRKPNGAPQFTGDRPGQPGEAIAIMHAGRKKKAWNGGGRHGFWDFPMDPRCRLHPTEKPIGLIVALLHDFTDSGESVLDPFMGSGTTLRAAKDLGRSAIGIEIEERYCEIAAKRLSQEVLCT